MIDLRDAAALQTKVIELQGLILTAQGSALGAQSEQFATMERLRLLEAKVSELEAWETEKQRYQLKDHGSETFAYALRHDASAGEPHHRLCVTCFENRRRSILQFKHKTYRGQEVMHCPGCKTDIALGTPREPPDYDPPRGSGWAA
jgi:hypothetical protein